MTGEGASFRNRSGSTPGITCTKNGFSVGRNVCGIFRDAVISIAATLAKQERLKISERTVAGLERACKQGRVGGRPKLVLDRDQVRRLREEGRACVKSPMRWVGLSLTTTARILKTA
jgi:DNA invertase Pin-like site-specific DNA recombinase